MESIQHILHFDIQHLSPQLLEFLGQWGYMIIFLGALTEAMPFLGLIVPGIVIVGLGGFLVRLHVLSFTPVLIVSSIGAILGDFIGFELGKRYGYELVRRYGKYFFFKPEHMEKTKRLVSTHTGKAIILGRFNSLTRSFAPFVAGTSDVAVGRFIFFNIVGGISWSILFICAGYIFGAGFEIAVKYFGFIFVGGIILSIVLVYLYRFLNKRRHVFAKYHLHTLILTVISVVVLSRMFQDAIVHPNGTPLDLWFDAHLRAIRTPLLTHLMVFFTTVGATLSMIVLSLTLAAYLMYRKRWHNAALLLISMIGGTALQFLIKSFLHRPRPLDMLVDAPGYSFPSAHALIAIVFFSVLIYSFKDDIKNRTLRFLFVLIAIVLFLLIGFSRLYLQVHWFTDVFGGFAVGLFWITLMVLILRWLYPHTSPKDRMF